MADTCGRGRCSQCGFDDSLPGSPLSLPLRTRLNNQYVVGRVLGKPGGFGVAYLGWDMTLETRVAIKEFLPRDIAARNTDRRTIIPYSKEDAEAFEFGLSQFLQEARTLAKFDHSNVVRVRAFFEENHTAYLVMDYYEGVSLQSYLDTQGGKIPERLAIDIIAPILDGLRDVHAKGFLHRDIKPQNIYLTQNGRPILLDFGAARFAMGERSRSLSVVLTPGFAPFEQYHRKGVQGPWTDIYACAATLYRMVTGGHPPEATEREKIDELTPPNQILEVTERFNAAILKGLSTEPGDRPQTVNEFHQMLFDEESVQVEIDNAKRRIPEKTATLKKLKTPTRVISKGRLFNYRLLLGLIVITAIAIGIVAYLLSNSAETSQAISSKEPAINQSAQQQSPRSNGSIVSGSGVASEEKEMPAEKQIQKKGDQQNENTDTTAAKTGRSPSVTESDLNEREHKVIYLLLQSATEKAAILTRDIKTVPIKNDNLRIAESLGEKSIIEGYKQQIDLMEQNIRDGLLAYGDLVKQLADQKQTILDEEFEQYKSDLSKRQLPNKIKIVEVVRKHANTYLQDKKIDTELFMKNFDALIF